MVETADDKSRLLSVAGTLVGPLRKNDDFLIDSLRSDHPRIRVYRQENVEIVLGASCRPDHDLFLDACRQDGVPVQTRRGGGGAVVLSPGQIIVLAAGPLSDRFAFHGIFGLINNCLIAALERAGIESAENAGVCDLALGDRKVHGGSLYLGRDRFFYQGSLLYDPDLKLFERYLRYPSREPEYRRGRGHFEFCTTLVRAGARESLESLAGIIGRELETAAWDGIAGYRSGPGSAAPANGRL